MAQSPQFNDSQNSLLAKIAANTGESQPKVGDGQHNLLFKIAQNTYASAVNGSGSNSKVDISTESYSLVQPQDNLAEKYQQFKNLTPSSPSSLLNGLLAFYKLGDTSDSSGNGNTLTNNEGVAFANGKIGNAAEFDESNYLSVSLSGITKNSSASVWINQSSQNGTPLVLGQSAIGNISIRDDGYIGAFLGDFGVITSDVVADFGDWYHVVGIYDGVIFKLFVNGVLKATQSTSRFLDNDLLYIGGEGGGEFNGLIDAVGIWNRALSDAEITALYNAGHGIEHPFFRSATNRATMFVVPGTYPLSSELAIDAEYVDLVGLGAQFQSPAVIVSNNTLNVTANDVRVSGISVGTQAFKIGNNKPLQLFENCTGGNNSFGYASEASGTFVGCVGGNESFGHASNASGVFLNCNALNFSFGAFGDATGLFKNCVAGEYGFGGDGGTLYGELLFCRLTTPTSSYVTPSGSGIIRFCLDGDNNIVNADAP
jgi:hypothetical protein